MLVKVSKVAPNRIANYDNGGVRDREPTSLYCTSFYDPLSTDKPVFEAGATIATIPPIIYRETMDPLFFLFPQIKIKDWNSIQEK